MAFDIAVSTLGGHLCTVHAQPDWYGRDLKAQISELAGTSASKQKLLYGSKLIRNVDLLTEILLQPEESAKEPVEVLLVRQSYDLDYWLDEISKDFRRLRKAPEELKSDRDVVLAAIDQNPQAFKFASDQLRGDREVAAKALARDASLVDFMDMELWEDCELMMDVVPRRCRMYRHLSLPLRKNRELTMNVLVQEGELLIHAPPELQADRDIVLLAARNVSGGRSRWPLLSHVGHNLRSDKEVVMACLENGKACFKELAQDMREDEDVLRALVRGNPLELENVPAAIQSDRELVLAALHLDGYALKFAGELCDDRECVEAAVWQASGAFPFASARLRGDKDLALRVLDAWRPPCWPVSPFGGQRIQSPLESMPRELRADKEVILRAVQKDGLLLQFAEPSLRMDREVVTAAIGQSGMALEYVLSPGDIGEAPARGKTGKAGYRKKPPSEGDLLQDVELLLKAVKRSSRALHFCPKHLRKEVEELTAKR